MDSPTGYWHGADNQIRQATGQSAGLFLLQCRAAGSGTEIPGAPANPVNVPEIVSPNT